MPGLSSWTSMCLRGSMIINVVCLSIRRILQPFPSESSSPIECCLKRILEGKCHFPEETQSHSPDSHVYQTYLRIRIDTFLSWYLGIRGTHPATNTESVLPTGEPNSIPPRTNLVDPQMEKDRRPTPGSWFCRWHQSIIWIICHFAIFPIWPITRITRPAAVRWSRFKANQGLPLAKNCEDGVSL